MYVGDEHRFQLVCTRFVVGEGMGPGIYGVKLFFGTHVEDVRACQELVIADFISFGVEA